MATEREIIQEALPAVAFAAGVDFKRYGEALHQVQEYLAEPEYYVADGGAEPAFEGDPGIPPTLYRLTPTQAEEPR